jgi:carbonic anhydrase
MTFGTAINCMDGRVQLPVIQYLKRRFGVRYIDMVTEAGPDLILSEKKPRLTVQSIYRRVDISIKKHHSKGIAIVGHHDCAGNPITKKCHHVLLKKAIRMLKEKYNIDQVIALWVDKDFTIRELKN